MARGQKHSSSRGVGIRLQNEIRQNTLNFLWSGFLIPKGLLLSLCNFSIITMLHYSLSFFAK